LPVVLVRKDKRLNERDKPQIEAIRTVLDQQEGIR
jgi:hypothetical protein